MATDLEKLELKVDKNEEKNDIRYDRIEGKLDVIKDNHLAHIQGDMASINLGLTKTTTNVDWLLRYHWIVATASIGALITGVVNLMQ